MLQNYDLILRQVVIFFKSRLFRVHFKSEGTYVTCSLHYTQNLEYFFLDLTENLQKIVQHSYVYII